MNRMVTMKRLITLFLAGIFTFVGTLPVDAQGLSPAQLAKIKSVGSVYLSDDGQTAAYTLSIPANPMKENAPPSSDLYLLDVETGESIAFVTSGSVRNVAFRPGHNSITYLARKDGDDVTSLYEISLSGGESQKLYAFERSISSYEWASDGDHIAFIASEPADEAESPLPYSPEIYEENATNRWAYMQNVSMEGHEAHRIPLEGSVYDIQWSNDYSRLAIAVAPTPHVDDYYMSQKVVIVDHETRDVLAEVQHEGKLGQITWSPDDTRLAFIGAATIHDPIAGRLKIADAETGDTELLFEDFEGMFEQIKWEDNSTISYLASKGVWSEFGSLNADGSGMSPVLESGGPIISSFAKAGDTHIFDADTPTHPDEVYMMTDGASSLTRTTNSNPWLDDVEFADQEVVSYEARDGMNIEGLLIKPLDYEEGTRYPMITVVHGGPESHYNNGWLTAYSMAGQVGAAQGFAVFYPNYRGSTGRGVEFAMSSQADMAGAEFDDIVDGVDYLIDEGIVDKSKVGVTGGSYGGYATAWMSTYYSDRFAAGVMFVGISNNISKWGTSDIPEELFLVHARERIWNDYQDFLERSPVYYADQAETPLLIMHGKEDTRVDPGQSYELYRHIKTRTDTPVRLVLYPGEGHGNRRATAQYDYNLRMLRWFNQYLKGEKERPDSELQLEEMQIDN